MTDSECTAFINGKCTKRAYRSECDGHCCVQCRHGQEMTCTFVCPEAAEIVAPADRDKPMTDRRELQRRINRFVIYAIAVAIIFILYGIGFLLIFDRPVEYERFPEWSKSEKAAIKQIMREHGNVTIIRCEAGTYFERDGEIIWINRRG